MSVLATQTRSHDTERDDEQGWGNSTDYMFSFLTRFGTTPGWVVSLGVHVVVLMVLGTIVYHPTSHLLQMATTTEMMNPDEEPIVLDNAEVDSIGSTSSTPLSKSDVPVSGGGPVSAGSGASGNSPQAEVSKKIEEELAPSQLAMTEEVQEVAQDDLVQTINKSGSAATENTGGTQGAIDRVTFELLSSLRENKTLVVWLFDASLSLKARRELIADRFENVYRQLESLDGATSKHLKTAIATFGERTQILTPEPVDGIKELVPLVRGIKNDESGLENTFASLVMVGKKFQHYATNSGRKMIVIVVTDERGDDAPQYMEEAILLFRRPGTKCFVVGNAAPFGKQKGKVKWTFSPEEGGDTVDVEVDTGPETVFPDALRLPFFGVSSNGLDNMSAGYGPYALTRLCSETGGTFLLAEDGNARHYDPHIMRNYQPDYRPIRVVEQDLKKNKAKYALAEAAGRAEVDAIPVPTLVFPANNDNELREAISEAQKPLAVTDAKVSHMLGILEAGEKDRDKIIEPRWQAAFDLAMGRALAMRARTLGYNTILAEMKLNPKSFTKKGNNQWILKPAKEVNAVPEIKKKASKAALYLKRVIDHNPDTPWADFAERELSEPMGWEWAESIDAAGRLAMATPEEKKVMLLLADETKKKQAMQAPKQAKRKPPKL